MKIGELIKKRFEDSGISVTAFGKKISVTRGNVYNIFTRDSIDTELLERISVVLHHDFFKYFNPLNEDKGRAQNLLEEPEIKYVRKREEILTKYIEELEAKLAACEKRNVIQ